MFEAVCQAKECMDQHTFRKATPPDMYVQVDYGEYEEESGREKRIGRLGRTSVMENRAIADFGGEEVGYSRVNQSHHFSVRECGFFKISLRDRDPVGHDDIGSTVVDLTELGRYQEVPLGLGTLSFEVYASLPPDPTTTTTESIESST